MNIGSNVKKVLILNCSASATEAKISADGSEQRNAENCRATEAEKLPGVAATRYASFDVISRFLS